MAIESETFNSDGLRRSIIEDAPEDLVNNIRLYDELRLTKIRDQHISYCRSVSKALTDGKSLEYVVATVTREVPLAGMDVTLTVQLLNYFMEEGGHGIQFDHLLNARTINGVVESGATTEGIQAYNENLAVSNRKELESLVEATGKRVINGFSLDVLMQFVRSDIVWDSMDSTLFSEMLNEYLEEHGSEVRFDRYLDPIA